MKVISLSCKNHGAIEAMELELNNGNYVVSGKSGTGKTTAISLLWDLIVLNSNIKEGQRKEVLEAYLEDGKGGSLTCKRENTKSGSKISICDEEGEVVPPVVARKLLSDISKNPLALFEKTGNERFDYLLKCSNVDFKEYVEKKKKRKEFVDNRLAQKHIADNVKSKLGEEPEKVEHIDIVVKQESLKKAHKHNYDFNNSTSAKETFLSGVESLENKKTSLIERIEEIKKDIEGIDVSIKDGKESIKRADDWLNDNPEIETEALQEEINTAVATNEKYTKHEEWKKRNTDLMLEESRYEEAQEDVKDVDSEIKSMLDGLSFALDGVTAEGDKIMYKGFEYDKLGTSDQILISAALTAQQIVTQKNSIHAIRIDRGESMDPETEKEVIKTCNKIGVQVFISLVDRSSKDEKFNVEIIEAVK